MLDLPLLFQVQGMFCFLGEAFEKARPSSSKRSNVHRTTCLRVHVRDGASQLGNNGLLLEGVERGHAIRPSWLHVFLAMSSNELS